ncbi:MAG: hypothetical protein QW724_04790 [Nitrososphaerota archaeon]
MSNVRSPRDVRTLGEESDEEEERIEAEDEEYKICKEIIDEAAGGPDYEEAYELYLSKAVDYEAIKWGPFSADVKIEKWDESRIHPSEITISLEYKTGDGVDRPYAEYPIDREFSETFRKYGWSTEGKGVMIYGYRCWKCGAIISEDELKYDDRWRRKCPRCGATSTKSHSIRIVKGKKWLRAYKKIKLTGGESREQIRKILIDTVKKPAQEFSHSDKNE